MTTMFSTSFVAVLSFHSMSHHIVTHMLFVSPHYPTLSPSNPFNHVLPSDVPNALTAVCELASSRRFFVACGAVLSLLCIMPNAPILHRTDLVAKPLPSLFPLPFLSRLSSPLQSVGQPAESDKLDLVSLARHPILFAVFGVKGAGATEFVLVSIRRQNHRGWPLPPCRMWQTY